MKLTTLLLLINFLHISANIYSQNERFTFKVDKIEIRELFEKIEQSSKYKFLYRNDYINDRTVTVDTKNASIEELLGGIFKESDVTYTIINGNLVVVAPRDNVNSFQQVNVSGTVTDAVTKEALPGVNITIEGTTIGTVTDSDGKYTIGVQSKESILIFSMVGYETQKIAYAGNAVVDIALVADIKNLEEVVVIGYGVAKKKDLTGSVTSIKSEKIENERPQAVQDILRGNVAGLRVGWSASAKGNADMQVRGQNNLRSSNLSANSPLIVLDGIIYTGELNDINPTDIQSVDVLKDASSAAVFGSRAANSVILITTKKGKEGKPQITVNSSFGFATLAEKEEVYDPQGFMKWRSDLFKSRNMYGADGNKLYMWDDPSKIIDGSTVTEAMWRNGQIGELQDIWLTRLNLNTLEQANYKKNKSVDWSKHIFQTGLRHDHNISVSGKKDDVSYYTSLGYNKNEGVLIGDEFSVIRGNMKVDANVTKWINVGINSIFSHRDESAIRTDWNMLINSPYGSEYKDDGVTLRYSPVDDVARGSVHPLYNRTFQDRRRTYNYLKTNLFASIKLPLGITYQLNFTPEFTWYNNFNHQSALHEDWNKFGGQVNRDQRMNYNWQLDNTLKWNKTFNNIHRIDATILVNAEKFQSWSDNIQARGFDPTDALGYHNVQLGTTTSYQVIANDNYSTGSALMGRLFYSLKDRYMVTLTMRRDGYSAFGLNHPFGYFPSAALAWTISEESFAQSDILTYAKIRASWGLNGNREIGAYDAYSTFNQRKHSYATLSGTAYETVYIDNSLMANPDLKWESTAALNLGLDFALFNGILDGSIDVYKKNTKDLILNRTVVNVTGMNNINVNLGEIENKGIELALNSQIFNKENFKWNVNFNFSLNRNKIVHLTGDMVNVYDTNGNITGQREADVPANSWFIGHDINQIWAPKVLGVWQVGEEVEASKLGVFPGDFKVLDKDGNGKIEDSDKEFQGYTEPRFIWSLRQEFNLFKHWDISILANSLWGHYGVFNQVLHNQGFPERWNAYVLDYWTPENKTNDYARLSSAQGGAQFNIYREKSFIRLENISIGYTVPSNLLKKFHINGLRLSASVRNAFLWAPHWELWDPEQYRDPFNNDANGNPQLTSGPSPRTYTFGVSLTL